MMRTFAAVLIACGVAGSAGAQSLADRVRAAGDGDVHFHFASRPGVCGDGLHYIRVNRSYVGSYRSDGQRGDCEYGPVQVRVVVRGGAIDRVDAWVGSLHKRGGRDLGAVSAPEAATYLLQLARREQSGAASKAILPAVLADSAITWPALLGIARDVPARSTRQDASYWLSRFAAGALEGKPNDILDDEDHTGSNDLKRHAVFVLSQLPRDEGIPALLDAARTGSNWPVRSAALFWLGQSGDARALDLFEALLRK